MMTTTPGKRTPAWQAEVKRICRYYRRKAEVPKNDVAELIGAERAAEIVRTLLD